MNKRSFGTEGEYIARDYLIGQGYQVLEMNYRRYTGEIDLIVREGDRVVFVEVKRRTSARYGRPADAVTFTKRRRIVRTAVLYFQEKKLWGSAGRFDVIEIMSGQINHIKNAFDATGIL